jgi:hypothetical protein
MAISFSTLVVAASGQVACNLGEDVAILNLATGTYYRLDEVGAAIWRRLVEPVTVADLRDALLDMYDVDAGRCERDLVALLEKLRAEGLVELRAGDDPPAPWTS